MVCRNGLAERSRRRREVLSIASGVVVSGLAGCVGTLDGKSDPSDATPSDADGSSSGSPDVAQPDLTDARPYRMHQYGPDHAGVAAGSGPAADVEVAWTFREGPDDTYYEIGSPAIVDGTVYVAEGRSDERSEAATVVYALDGQTGEPVWRNRFPGSNALGDTAVVDGAVVQAISGAVVVLEAESGAERWRDSRDLDSAVTVADGTVYSIQTTYADPPALVAFSLETGEERWSAPLSDGRFWPTAPAVVDGTVYQGGSELVALSAETGTRRWERSLEVPATGSPTVVDDALYVPFGDGSLGAFSLDGTPRWRRSVERAGQGSGMDFVTSPAVAYGTCYVVNSWQLTALDAGDGAVLWTTEVGADGAPVVTDEAVYVGGLAAIVARDAETGARLWHHDSTASTGAGAVAPVAGETVFYSSGGLHALVEPDGST